MHRRAFLGALPATVLLAQHASSASAQPRKGVMLMNRIGPSSSELYIANTDGSDERKFLQDSVFDYNASFAPNGQWVVFTSERNGLGQSDVFRARPDGSGVEPLIVDPSMDDAAKLSPDGQRLAFVSTRDGYRANLWVRDLSRYRRLHNLTGGGEAQGDPAAPNSFLRPSWSPDGQWLAFSSDRLTAWRGHDAPHGWEHTQELSIYVSRTDGRGGLRRIAAKPGYCLGSPKWSPDGRRVVFYEITTEDTWGARRPNLVAAVTSQIVSVDVATGERIVHTEGPGLKVFPQFLSAHEIAYHRKGGADEGVVYTSGRPGFRRALRSPNWSPDGSRVIYEKVSFAPRRENLPLYSWDAEWDYRYSDVFPALSRTGELVFTEKARNSSIVIMNPDGSNRRRIFDVATTDLEAKARRGTAGAFQPAWSPDGQWIAFGLGEWFQERRTGAARIMRVRRDGSGLEALTDGAIHSGFPSYSADGAQIVYRVWGASERGLRILSLDHRSTRVLTTEDDNLPGWSPDGARIVFTRRVDAVNFDVYTIRPDGSDLQRLTTHGATDGHAVWTADGRILWSSGMYGFRDEAALYDNTFQQYGQIFVMNADGTGRRPLTDSRWEDAMPLYIPAAS